MQLGMWPSGPPRGKPTWISGRSVRCLTSIAACTQRCTQCQGQHLVLGPSPAPSQASAPEHASAPLTQQPCPAAHAAVYTAAADADAARIHRPPVWPTPPHPTCSAALSCPYTSVLFSL